MSVLTVGIDHNKADLDIRSIFSFTKKKTDSFYSFLKNIKGIHGSVVMSTCNRMELWLSVTEGSEISPFEILCGFLGVNASEYSSFFTERREKDAVNHLFRLASGLESRIIGEDQVLTQVGDALSEARAAYATDNTLEVLFRLAVTAGKRVKTETSFSTADRSVIHTALDMLLKDGFDVSGKKCLVIGNGMMGKLSAQTLLDRGADVTVTVREYKSGIVDIPKGCNRINYSQRYEILPQCDLVVSATSSPNHTICKADTDKLEINKKIIFSDLAVPRDIESEIKENPLFSLYDIDSFNIDLKNENLKDNIIKAESIIKEEENEFYNWYEGRDLIPLIRNIKENSADDMFERLIIEHKNSMESEIKSATERMMNKLLFGMRSHLSDSIFSECIEAMEKVFDKEK